MWVNSRKHNGGHLHTIHIHKEECPPSQCKTGKHRKRPPSCQEHVYPRTAKECICGHCRYKFISEAALVRSCPSQLPQFEGCLLEVSFEKRLWYRCGIYENTNKTKGMLLHDCYTTVMLPKGKWMQEHAVARTNKTKLSRLLFPSHIEIR